MFRNNPSQLPDDIPLPDFGFNRPEEYPGEKALRELGVTLEIAQLLLGQKDAVILASTYKAPTSSITEVTVNLQFSDDRIGTRTMKIAEFEVNPYLNKQIKPKSSKPSNYVVATDKKSNRTFVGEPENTLLYSLQYTE